MSLTSRVVGRREKTLGIKVEILAVFTPLEHVHSLRTTTDGFHCLRSEKAMNTTLLRFKLSGVGDIDTRRENIDPAAIRQRQTNRRPKKWTVTLTGAALE